jgi:hypothetical protein
LILIRISSVFLQSNMVNVICSSNVCVFLYIGLYFKVSLHYGAFCQMYNNSSFLNALSHFYVSQHVFNHFTKKFYEQRNKLHFNINNKICATSISIIINVHNMLQL